MKVSWRYGLVSAAILSAIAGQKGTADVKVDNLSRPIEQYDAVGFMRGPHILAFFNRHNMTFRRGAAIHAAHAEAHDMLQLSPLMEHTRYDAEFNRKFVELTLEHPPKTESLMQTYGPYTSQFAWQLYRAINWTHMHHEQTYDILSSKDIPWGKKKEWTDKAVKYYLEKLDIPRSPAPLDVTMRRAGVMMKPYFGYFRNFYPETTTYFYVAHWWHPVVYEAMMIAGNDNEQVAAVTAVDQLMSAVMKRRPQRMLLSREIMPRYSRMTPESANIFDNLHMLHGIAYAILAYPKWTTEQKEAELNRVIRAMSYQPGDEALARKFSTPYPDMDPRTYPDWMMECEGAMTRIMLEMLDEMMPMMAKNYVEKRMQAQEMARKKLCPGIQSGESEGSLHDAMMKLFPEMKMMPKAMNPGESSGAMMQAMLSGWFKKYGMMPDISQYEMNNEPILPPLSGTPVGGVR